MELVKAALNGFILIVVVFFALCSRSSAASEYEMQKSQLMSELPYWDDSLIYCPPESASMASNEVALSTVLDIVDEQLPPLLVNSERRLIHSNGTVTIRKQKIKSRLTFTSADRVYGSEYVSSAEMSTEGLEVLAAGFLAELGVPDGEYEVKSIRRVVYETRTREGEVLEIAKPEAVVDVDRYLAGIRVFSSQLRFTVNNNGDVSRFAYQWPQFHIDVDVATETKSEAEVVDEIVDAIVDRYGEYGPNIGTTMELAFIPADGGAIEGYTLGLIVYSYPMYGSEIEPDSFRFTLSR